MADTFGKLKRSHLIHAIDTTMSGVSPEWYIIGKDIEDLSVELNPDTETVKNILDETAVQDNGYEPSLEAETFYANPQDKLYSVLKGIAMERKTGDACKTKIVEILIDKENGPFDAWCEDVIIKPSSYGGPQGGVNIPFSVTFNGNRKKGTATITSGKIEFTEGE